MTDNLQNLTFSPLDPSQKNTFDSILDGEDNLHVVHGPPGTGKSQLVVSLLEGLASRDKKVLFVSQNTEALKVIERMIYKTQKDIGFPSDNKYLSLLDFCLMLYNPRHKQLKHLREHHSNLSGKELPTINTVEKPFNPVFSLRYTNLDHNINYGIEGDKIGFDELVNYFIKYVNQSIAPEPLREINNVDIRSIFKELEGYKLKAQFNEYNKPKRELILLSKKHTDITLPDVRHYLQDIKNAVKGNWMNFFIPKENIDVLDYLNLLKEYSSLVQYFDVYKLATEEVDTGELKLAFDDLLEKSKQIDGKIAAQEDKHAKYMSSSPLEIHGVTEGMDYIQIGKRTTELAQESISSVVSEKDRIATLIVQLSTKYPDVEFASVVDVWQGMSKVLCAKFSQVINETESKINNKAIANLLDKLYKLDKDQLEIINKDMSAFAEKISHLGTIKRMLASVPDSIKNNFGITMVNDFVKFNDSLSSILPLLQELMNTGDTVRDTISPKDSAFIPLQKLNILPPSSIEELMKELLPLNELQRLLQKHEIKADNYSRMKQDIKVLHKSLLTLTTISSIPENKRLFIGSSLSEIIESINTNIDALICLKDRDQLLNDRRMLWNDSYNDNKTIVIGARSTEEFEEIIPKITEYLSHKSDQIPKLLKTIEIPNKNISFDTDIKTIESAIQSANNTDYFSDDFFEVRADGNMQKWLDSVSILDTYNNDAEVLEYSTHNKFVNDIKNALGAANLEYIDNILSNDITFQSFAARLVNAIVGEVFGRASAGNKSRISTVDLLRAYENYLKFRRSISYTKTLRNLHKKTMSVTRELSKQSTLQAAGKSTMEKFRHNTVVITDAFPIVCATPKDVAKYIAPLAATFDYVIFDEASQLLPGQALPSIYRAKKAVIIGDPHQMPPSLNASFSQIEQSEDEFDDLGESILDLIIKQPKKEHRLKVHYRSKYNKLFEPSRRAIYSEKGVEPIFEAELANGAPIDLVDDLGDEIDEYGYDKNFSKVCEAVEEYMSQDENADFCVLFTTGGVLQSFRSYMEEVGAKLHKKMSELYDKDKILLSTVTNCQGIEGTYTVLYLHHYARPGAMWFFREQAGAYKRLNVSITRQREGLKLLLADPRAQWIAACDQKINSETTGHSAALSANLMKSLLTNAGEQADESYLDRELGYNNSWFDSPLTEQLYNKLTDHYDGKIGRDLKIYSEVGWNLVIPRGSNIDDNERNVGFRIDIGVYSTAKKRFILGIEMDGAMYHSGYEKEHSDYTRQKVLEAKGWDIYRIWSTNWLLDIEKEFSRLTDKIDEALL